MRNQIKLKAFMN